MTVASEYAARRCHRPGQLDVDGVPVDRHTAVARELAKTRAVRPHDVELLTLRVQAEGIAGGIEHDRAGRGILTERSVEQRAAAGEGSATAPRRRRHTGIEAGQLSQMAAESIDAEDLARPRRILSQRVSGGSKDDVLRSRSNS